MTFINLNYTMKKIFLLCITCFIISVISSCFKNKRNWQNKDFERALDEYYSYVDSIGYKHGFDYINIEAKKSNDSLVFLIYLYGGAYDFLSDSTKIIDFYQFKKYDILLKGDFPN